ncbi:MAG: hypothetical protein AUK47_06055 [Deltaproteobacteria bacterium CG2_30_63_29]|nr:MAG: hypothetical protein AUK47_06055 [Deltaproteobacteria bacterium CG2_30_63_29]
MGLLDRLNLLIRSNINLSDESPSGTTGHVRTGGSSHIRDLEKALVEVRSRVSSVLEDERDLERTLDDFRREEEVWERRAAEALRGGDEDGARGYLLERNRVGKKTKRVRQELKEHRTYVADLMNALEALEAKLAGMREKRQLRQERTPEQRAKEEQAPRIQVPQAPPASAPRSSLDDDVRSWESLVNRRKLAQRGGGASLKRPHAPRTDALATGLDQVSDAFSKFDDYEAKLDVLEADVAASIELNDFRHHHDEDDPLFDPKMEELERRFRELERKDRSSD